MTENSSDSSLLSFVEQVSGDTFLKVEENLGQGFVRLKTSEAERRQAKHDIRAVEDIIVELLRNSRDAGCSRIFVATNTEGDFRRITVLDDGVGVPQNMQSLIFEPRVTSKLETMVIDEWGVHGRGMALFSISQNVETCELMASMDKGGTSLSIKSDTAKLKERADQSRWPKVRRIKENDFEVESGPKNLIRNVVEFALANRKIDVYFGSPSEILATLYTLGSKQYESYADAIAQTRDIDTIPLWTRPARSQEPNDICSCASGLGFDVSLRNCYRIINGEIGVLPTVFEKISNSFLPVVKPTDIFKDPRGLKIHSSDMRSFQIDLEKAFDTLAQKYFLSLNDEVKVKVTKDHVHVTFDYGKEQ